MIISRMGGVEWEVQKSIESLYHEIAFHKEWKVGA